MAGALPKILVVEDEEHIRNMLVEILSIDDYEVLQAEDGEIALEIANIEHPDLILMDVWMPGMDGLETLEKMRMTSAMEETPCILITAMDPSEGEQAALDLAADHYLTKPVDPATVQAAVRSALRNVGTVTTPIVTGHPILDKKALAGGIPVGSLTLIEGSSASGKSVLVQQLMCGSLQSGHQVACFTSEDTERSLLNQMNSLNLKVNNYVAKRRFRIQRIEEPGRHDEPEEFLSRLAMQISTLPKNYKAIFVDAITNLASVSEETAIMSYFYACKNLCTMMGRSIILVAHASAFEERLLIRVRSLCDAHFNMRVENAGNRQVRVLEVSKIHNADLTTGEVVTFVVEPNVGMAIIPVNKIRV